MELTLQMDNAMLALNLAPAVFQEALAQHVVKELFGVLELALIHVQKVPL